MKFLSTAATLIIVGLVPFSTSSRSISLFGSSQAPIQLDGANSVPGNNPLEYCPNTTKDFIKIESVDLDPNPPVPGKSLIINAEGTLYHTIEFGAYVRLQVKYGLIVLINEQVDLCDQLVNVDLKCPLEKGRMSLTKQFYLPRQIPPGKYSVRAEVYSHNDQQITCLEATNIEFKFK